MTLWAADSHVHFHKQFNIGEFFDSCFINLTKISDSDIENGILFFTEGWNEDYFNQLRTVQKITSSRDSKSNYKVNDNKKNSFEIRWEERGMTILAIQGYQVVSKEKIEVLSLGTKTRISDGASVEAIIMKIKELGGVPILPWGFGKWIGVRGRIVDELISNQKDQFFIGDNGGRTSLIPYPKQFRMAKEKNIKILPGSDPLPFPSEADRALSYGFLFNIDIDEADPWNSIKVALLSEDFSVNEFGKLTNPISFIKNQISMQLKKRSSK
jgi:hypothetical protein